MRSAVGILLCILLCPQIAWAASPAGYPVRPIRLVVPQSPGGGTDLYARVAAQPLAERLGQSVVIDNRAGAGSLIGTDLVAKAVPDGYTLLAISSAITIIPSMYREVPFDTVRDFAPVALVSVYPHLLVAHPALQANSVRELIALAKARPAALNFASAGIGTPTQLGGELFKSMAGINLVHVPYKGGGPSIVALLGGEAALYFGPIGTVLTHVRSGKLKALASTGAQRSRILPELPTVAESGLPGFEQTGWNGLVAPARTPPAILDRLHAEMSGILKSPALRERFAVEGVEPGEISRDELGARLKSEVAKWARIVREAGIRPE